MTRDISFMIADSSQENAYVFIHQCGTEQPSLMHSLWKLSDRLAQGIVGLTEKQNLWVQT